MAYTEQLTRTALSVAQEEMTKVNYGGNKRELRFDFTRIMDAVSEELGYENIGTYVIFGEVSETKTYWEKNKAKTCFTKLYTSNGQPRVTYSNTKLAGVASGKKKARFTVDAEYLVERATELVSWLKQEQDKEVDVLDLIGLEGVELN